MWSQAIDELCAKMLIAGVELPTAWVVDDGWHKCEGGAYRLNSQLPFFAFFAANGGSPVVSRHDAQRLLTMHQEALIASALARCPNMGVPAHSAAPTVSLETEPARVNAAANGVLTKAQTLLKTLLEARAVPTLEIQKRATAAGFRWMTVRRAAVAIGVSANRIGFGRGGKWQWELPRLSK